MQKWLKRLGTPALETMIATMEKNKLKYKAKLALIEERQANCARELVSRDIQEMLDNNRS